MEPLDARKSGSRNGGPSFSLGNRVLRVVWGVSWLALARWTPPMLHGWRAFVLRLFGARLGRGCRIHAGVDIWLPSNLTLGDNVLIGSGARIYNQGAVSIGSDSVISQGAYLCASTHDVCDPHFQLELRPISIDSQCWVAADGFVGPGVTMGEGSVVAARGALFEDAQSWSIYRGNPAERIKARELQSGVG